MATTNLSRRNFAKGAAIAGALASIPAAAVLADDTEADAELLELGRQLAALFEEHAIASEEYDRAFAEFVQPERPATLKATTDDLALIGDPETVGGPIGRSRRR